MVCSLNYQKLYEFSKEYKFFDETSNSTISKKQTGTLNTISPAIAIQLWPSLYFGFTINFWLEDAIDDYWENESTRIEEKVTSDESIKIYGRCYEYYGFSGVNSHIGLMWRPSLNFNLGVVVKTPFNASINHERQLLSYEEHSKNQLKNIYYYKNETNNLTLKMPLSYGIGANLRFGDNYVISFDVYRTHGKTIF